ncbi:MAG: agmatine deiminase family protein [Verrucomicrobiia bacterium]|jgi:agmatine deiminase
MIDHTAPADLAYRMPAEWEPHAGTWLTWPRREGISFPGIYDVIPPVYAEFIRTLVKSEDVYLNVWDEAMEQEVRAVLAGHKTPLDRVFFHQHQAYEPWCRDHGPIFVVRENEQGRERAIVDWEYNAWGGKYPPFDLDNDIPRQIADLRGLQRFTPGIVLEGGSIDVNGKGTLITTDSCLLNKNRNPQLTKAEIESGLKAFLGVTKILWLGEGIVGDDTDGHVDDLTRFIGSSAVVTIVEDDPADENFAVLHDNLERLRGMTDQDGSPLRIVELPMPDRVEFQGERLPASYANFYIANRAVVVPTYRCANDAKAIEILQKEFPDRRVIGIDSTKLAWGFGSFHCISQQEPAE